MAKWYISQSGQWSVAMFKCNQFPTLTSYAGAKQWHDYVVPMVSGHNKGKRPIHDRNRAYWHIVDTGERIEFREHDRVIVAWLPNGEIHVTPMMFNCCYEQLTSLLDTRFFRKDNKLWVNTHQTMALQSNEANIFKPDKNGFMQFLNPPRRTKKVVNRIAAKKVRQRYKAFRDYIKQTHALRDDGYSYQECLEMFGKQEKAIRWNNSNDFYWLDWDKNPDPKGYGEYKEGCIAFLEKALDPEQFYRASLRLAYSAGNGVRRFHDESMRPNLNTMYEVLDRCIYYVHREEVFEDKELSEGDTSRDTYAYLFK